MGDDSSSSSAGNAFTAVLIAWGTKEVAEELGVDEDAATLVGLGTAAAYSAGAFSSNEAPMSSGGETGAAGTAAGSRGTSFDYTIPSLSLSGGGGQESRGGAPPPPPAVNTPVESGPLVSGQVNAPSSLPPSAGGMLTQGMDADLSMSGGPPKPVETSPGTQTSSAVIANETVGRVDRPDGKPSWWERVFSNDKTMDLLMAGMAGAGEAGMREFEIERPYEREDELADRWKRSDPGGGGLLRMGRSMPSTRR
jgi:hypothetical protein